MQMPVPRGARGAFRRAGGLAGIARIALVGALAAVACSSQARSLATELPDRLSDQAFWRLSATSSEPGGYFRSQDITNLTSNELGFEYVIPDLITRVHSGSGTVYLGVGPEQNYTYMAALRPKLAVIFDIRRGNLDLQLMYKAIFEIAADRAEFISLLFSKPRPAGLTGQSTVADLFRAFGDMASSDPLFRRNLAAIEERLTKVHGLPLLATDLSGVRTIYQSFYYSGFAVRPAPRYDDLMTATDAAGAFRSYLASEDAFAYLKDLESKNLVVPVVGDFGGPKAIRAVATYLKSQGAVVQAFYLSNVEQYLYQDGKWEAFCRNVAALPLDAGSTFIRSTSGGGGFGFGRGGGFISSLGEMAGETKECR
jgi:hypothetical protein